MDEPSIPAIPQDYHTKGWPPLNLPAGIKEPPPIGRTGFGGVDMTKEEIDQIVWSGNIAVRTPEDVLGIDIDAYRGGLVTFDQLVEDLGPLPKTWISHNGRDDGSGIRFFRVPVGMAWVTTLAGIDIIQRDHRYAVVWPSTHPDGRLYGWWDQAEGGPTEDIPAVEDLPELPWPWINELARATQADLTVRSTAANPAQVTAFLTDNSQRAGAQTYLTTILDHFTDHWHQGYSRHDTMQHCLIWAMEMARAEVITATSANAVLGSIWSTAVTPDQRRMELVSDRRTTEFAAMLRHAIGKATAKPQGDIDKLHDDYVGIQMNPGPTPEAAAQPLIADYQASTMTGGAFIFDRSTDIVARWGRGTEVLWAQGESILLVGPTGVGKTTVASQIVGALIGLMQTVLGYPVAPAKKVLYLAMDRPRQIARAFQRLFDPGQRRILDERLVVHRGPLPTTLSKNPRILIEMAQAHGADVLIVDSLKDAAAKLSDETVAGDINTAIQFCNVADVDVLVLHHQRKSVEGKKPTSLEDVYGSTWITAGSGSVVLLWGDPGSEQIELSHLKQPADMIGPLDIEHDHIQGTSVVVKGWDALIWLRNKGPGGGTIAEAAQAQHGTPQKPGSAKAKQTERRLRQLVKDGLATSTGQLQVGAPVRYFALILPSPSRGQPRGQSVKTDTVDKPVDNPVDNLFSEDKRAGQSVDNPVDKQ